MLSFFFTANCYCIAWIKCCWQCTKPKPFIFYPKLSDLVLLDTTLSLVCARRRICNDKKERDPFFYAQMKTRNYCTVRRRNGPTGRNKLGATRQVKDN